MKYFRMAPPIMFNFVFGCVSVVPYDSSELEDLKDSQELSQVESEEAHEAQEEGSVQGESLEDTGLTEEQLDPDCCPEGGYGLSRCGRLTFLRIVE